MTANIINGKEIAERVRQEVRDAVAELKATGVTPGLAVVIVGADPASQVYVKNKTAQTIATGMQSFQYELPDSTSEIELLALVAKLNADPEVHGILVQLPLPKQIDDKKVIAAIAPEKDVDGFHRENVGLLTIGEQRFVPCTPAGIMRMLSETHVTVKGAHAVVLGRSNIVGKPIALLLLAAGATVTVCHSSTRDLAEYTRQADILVVAIGRANFVTADMVKPGAIVIDVGINRLPAEAGGGLCGDVEFASVAKVAGAITPVPGGVGPMTIAMLLQNTVLAAKSQTTPKAL